jgi:hypothetical protein
MDDILSVMKDGGTSPADFFACFDKLVELGEWTKFEWWSIQRQPIGSVSYIQWLLSRTESGEYRLCILCAEWLAQKEAHNANNDL